MMGHLKSDQGQLFYEFRLGDAVPEDRRRSGLSGIDRPFENSTHKPTDSFHNEICQKQTEMINTRPSRRCIVVS
jgi:hypothetical protein